MINSKKIEHVIIKYQIEQIHIHQFECIPYVFPACVNTNRPYISFVHTGIEGTYDWFENHYYDFKRMFEIFFRMSCKIICITENAKKEIMKKYIIPDENFMIVNNSIKFCDEIINNSNIPSKIQKFLIISRLNEVKKDSIVNAINIFKQYASRHEEAILTIVGDGEIKNEIETIIEDIRDKVTFLGKRTDIFEILFQNDILIGLDRCVLEAIVSKRLAIVSGYKEIKGIVKPDNIKEFSKENFSGKELKNATIEGVIDELEKLDEKQIKQIVEKNYDYAYEKLNLDNNIFIFNGNNNEYIIDMQTYMELESDLVNKIADLEEEKNYIYSESKKMQAYYEQQIENLKNDNLEKIKSLTNEVEKYKEIHSEDNQDERKNIIYDIYNKIKNKMNKLKK